MKKREIIMTEGPLLGKILKFSIPLMMSGMLQLVFNAADNVVVGRFSGSNALASVGATTSLIHLLINLFIGLSVGAAVTISHSIGSGNLESASEHAHNAIATSLLAGVFIGIVGIVIARPVLSAMDTPAAALDGAVLYFQIYFAGAPFLLLYNFGAAILRSVGDTSRPFVYLAISGVVNVILNLIFVINFDMSVLGVALATLISNAISSLLVLRALIKTEGTCQIKLARVKIYKNKLSALLRIGLPAGLQSCMFSFSNVFIQSSINSFGELALAGNTAAISVLGFLETGTSAFSEATVTFTSQNHGAGKYDRVRQVGIICALSITIIGIIFGVLIYLYSHILLSFYLPGEEDAIFYGKERLLYLSVPHALLGIMNAVTGLIRGLDSHVFPMVVTIFGVCILRIIYLYTVFPLFNTLASLYIMYPITWLSTTAILFVHYIHLYRKLARRTA